MISKQKISTFLWFDTQAEEAAKFYTSIFKNSRITATTRYSKLGPGPEGSVMTVGFELGGQPFTALNGGPIFKFNESVSLVVHCTDQKEVDTYWKKLTAGGGEESQCGWLKDKYGLSWQIVPEAMLEMIKSPDADKKARAVGAMFKMRKLNIAKLKKAFNGK